MCFGNFFDDDFFDDFDAGDAFFLGGLAGIIEEEEKQLNQDMEAWDPLDDEEPF